MKAVNEPGFTDISPIIKLTGKQTNIASELYSRRHLSSVAVTPSPLIKPKLVPLASLQATHDQSHRTRPRNVSLIQEPQIPLVNDIAVPVGKQHNLDLANELMIANAFEFKRPRANSRVLTLDRHDVQFVTSESRNDTGLIQITVLSRRKAIDEETKRLSKY